VSRGGLDIYALAEDMLDIHEVMPILNEYYFNTLETLKFKTLLDVGCGSGAFLKDLSFKYPSVETMGIDLSPVMVKKSQAKGLNVHCIDLCQVDNKFDVITAVFDMVNYLNEKELKRFLSCVEDRLEEGGYFICDINTLYAFKVVASGSFIKDVGDRFLTIDSDYIEVDGVYDMDFTLFSKKGETFSKLQESVRQYYHKVEKLKKLTKMKMVSKTPIAIYGNTTEKFYLLFRK
jgi:SAM-dependent methyltransferase